MGLAAPAPLPDIQIGRVVYTVRFLTSIDPMGNPNRTLLIIACMGVLAVIALAAMASRYDKALKQRQQRSMLQDARPKIEQVARSQSAGVPGRAVESRAAPAIPAEVQAELFVDAFLAVRTAMNAAIVAAVEGGVTAQIDAMQSARTAALQASGIDLGEYRQVRALWRIWEDERRAPTTAFERAFVARAADLGAADLGALEAHD